MPDYAKPYINKLEGFSRSRNDMIELILIGGLAMRGKIHPIFPLIRGDISPFVKGGERGIFDSLFIHMVNFKYQGGNPPMPKVIDAVYENGVFKPLEKVNVPEHKKLRIILPDKAEHLAKGKCSLAGIIDIAKDCTDKDLSVHHDKYLYGEAVD